MITVILIGCASVVDTSPKLVPHRRLRHSQGLKNPLIKIFPQRHAGKLFDNLRKQDKVRITVQMACARREVQCLLLRDQTEGKIF